MYGAYCAKEDPFCNDVQSRDCVYARGQACGAQYDGTCGASSAVVDSVDHEIDMIISPQTTCEGLRSIDSHVWDVIVDWNGVPCEGGGGQATTAVSELCENAVAGVCSKMVSLGCVEGSASDCEQLLLASGVIVLGGVPCTLSTPTSESTSGQQADFDTAMAEANGAQDCSTFGL